MCGEMPFISRKGNVDNNNDNSVLNQIIEKCVATQSHVWEGRGELSTKRFNPGSQEGRTRGLEARTVPLYTPIIS